MILTSENLWETLTKYMQGILLFSCSAVSTLCDPMDCSTPGIPVLHQFPESAQTHVHWVTDAIQPSHPLLPPSPLALNFSQHQGLSSESALHIRWPKYCIFSFSISPSNEYSELITFRIDWFDLLAVQGTLKSLLHPSVLSLLYGPTLTSIRDYWKKLLGVYTFIIVISSWLTVSFITVNLPSLYYVW